jgi:hypothetical protein
MKRMGYLKYVLLLVLIFFLAGCPPYLVEILTPSDGAEFEVGDKIEFTGSAMDWKDGKLEGGSLVWTSSIDDEIGTGAEFTRDDLTEGTHTITLTATNSGSEKWMATVTVQISAPPAACIPNGDPCLGPEGTRGCCSGCCCGDYIGPRCTARSDCWICR